MQMTHAIRRRGIGRYMIRAAELEAHTTGCNGIILRTQLANKKARKFYEEGARMELSRLSRRAQDNGYAVYQKIWSTAARNTILLRMANTPVKGTNTSKERDVFINTIPGNATHNTMTSDAQKHEEASHNNGTQHNRSKQRREDTHQRETRQCTRPHTTCRIDDTNTSPTGQWRNTQDTVIQQQQEHTGHSTQRRLGTGTDEEEESRKRKEIETETRGNWCNTGQRNARVRMQETKRIKHSNKRDRDCEAHKITHGAGHGSECGLGRQNDTHPRQHTHTQETTQHARKRQSAQHSETCRVQQMQE